MAITPGGTCSMEVHGDAVKHQCGGHYNGKGLPLHKRRQKAISPSTNWLPHVLPLFVLDFTNRKAEFSPGFFPYCPGLHQPLLQIPANHSPRASTLMGTSPAPHLLPSTLPQTLGVFPASSRVFLQPHTFHQSTLHCQSPIPI